ncbi:MAG: sulfite exporter TauE/SafE family protein [Deltaproteobacteria bacterium]|nr:sulfite exporter TauE/SafE family protein [Deltaproteobacteria bacterium]
MGSTISLLGLGAASFVAGAINSVAGGGSLLSFPALVAFGQPAILANATNTAVVWPGTLSSAFAYRKDFPADRGLVLMLVVSSLLGGLLGAAILVGTPPALFQKLTPFLVLFATGLFAARRIFARLLARTDGAAPSSSRWGRAAGFAFQFGVATYGGYFGAGAGMLMLASFGLMGLTDIHRMNALKTTLATLLNGIALLYFAAAGLVVWHLALGMGACAVAGGYSGARLAKRVDQRIVQKAIVALGLCASAWLFAKAW